MNRTNDWRLCRPYHVMLHRGFWHVYKTDHIAPDGIGYSASPTEFYYTDRMRAKAKAKELNDNFKFSSVRVVQMTTDVGQQSGKS